MDTNDLLKQLRLEAAQIQVNNIEEKLIEARRRQAEQPRPLGALPIYNYETFLELRNISALDEPTPINEKKLGEMKAELDRYMNEHMPGADDYKLFIRIVSVYLTFIARKPLHPPGIFNGDGQAIYRDGKTICPLRAEELGKPGSLCRFCESAA